MRVKDSDVENLRKLPDWVKCVVCHKPPIDTDWLFELVPHSSALMHQSCSLKLGKMPGVDIGPGTDEKGESK